MAAPLPRDAPPRGRQRRPRSRCASHRPHVLSRLLTVWVSAKLRESKRVQAEGAQAMAAILKLFSVKKKEKSGGGVAAALKAVADGQKKDASVTSSSAAPAAAAAAAAEASQAKPVVERFVAPGPKEPE